MSPPDVESTSGAMHAVRVLTRDRSADHGAAGRAALVGITRLLQPAAVVPAGTAAVPDGLDGETVRHVRDPGAAVDLPAPTLAIVDASDPDADALLGALLGPAGIRDGVVVIIGCGSAAPPALTRARPASIPKVAFVDAGFVPPSGAADDGMAVIAVDASRLSYGAPPAESTAAWRPGAPARADAPPNGRDLTRLVHLQDELDRERARSAELEATIDRLYATTSWRVSRPLRMVGDVRRRLSRAR